MAEEKKNIASIMSRLMKKQRELEEDSKKENDGNQDISGDFDSDYYDVVRKAPVEEGPTDNEVADWLSEVPSEEPSAAPADAGDISLIIDEVMKNCGDEDSETIARRVQELYNELRASESAPKAEEPAKPVEEPAEEPVLQAEEPAAPAEEPAGIVPEEPAKQAEEPVEQTEVPAEPYGETAQDEIEYKTLFAEEPEEDIPVAETAEEPVTAEDPVAETAPAPAPTPAVTDENPSGTKDDDDAILMAALGYGGANGKPAPAPMEKKKPKARVTGEEIGAALAFRGKEYTNHRQDDEINAAYETESRLVMIRLVATAVLTVLSLVFDLFGSKFPGFLSAYNYPITNIMFSLQILLICALFSVRELWNGIKGLINARPVGSTVTAGVFAATLLYNIVLAIYIRASGSNVFTLYNSPCAFCLFIQVIADFLRVDFEKKNFRKLSSFKSVNMLVKEEEGTYILKKGAFAEGYFRRTNKYNNAFLIANFAIAPVIALALIMFIVALACGRGFGAAINTFIVFVQIALPVFAVMALDIPFYIMNYSRGEAPSVILNGADVADYGKVDRVVLSETDMFAGDSLEIRSFKSCVPGSDFFNDLTAVSAICTKVGGTISGAFRNVSAGQSGVDPAVLDRIQLSTVVSGGIDAELDGRRYVLGSANFLFENGIPCANCNDDEFTASEKGGVVFHISVDKQEILRLFMVYRVNKDFAETVETLSESDVETEVRVLDPNLNPEFIAALIGNDRIKLKVVRVENNPAEAGADAAIEGGIISDGKDWMAAVALADMCKSCNPVASVNRKVAVVLEILACILAMVLSIIGTCVGMSPVFILLVYIATLAPSFIISRFV